MLIRFVVKNFRSFKEEVVFSLLPGRMQKHADHIVPGSEHGIDVLRGALIYGANASGKSNLIKAMAFAQDFILEGTRPKQVIPVEPFRLDKTCINEPSRFEFEFIVAQQAYAYGFAISRQRVHEEWLYSLSMHDEQPLFERETDAEGKTQAKFGDSAIRSDDERQFLEFIKTATRPNQLMLTTAAENNVSAFEAAYEWFRETLKIIFPSSKARGIQVGVHKDQKFTQALTSFLRAMDTGIAEVCIKPVDEPQLPDSLLEQISADLNITGTSPSEEERPEHLIVVDGPHGERYLLQHSEIGELETYALGTRHQAGKESVDFDLVEESDGTQRLFDLFPTIYGTEDRVFVIDELERSLHPNLVTRFIRHFLQESSNQLIFTTHESTLLDLDLLRRDEIWFVEKSPDGASMLYSLESFKPRHDLDIRKGYLHGRFGAIPVFGSSLVGGESQYHAA